MALPFKDAFCACYKCKPEEFQQKAADFCLYPRARILWRFLDLVGARTTLGATTLLELAGQTRSEEDLCDVIKEYHHDLYRHVGWPAKLLGLRISTERLLALYRNVRSMEVISNA
ncbi:MAG: hypothetical protein ACXWDN_01410 [Limisphaerales bacterium]